MPVTLGAVSAGLGLAQGIGGLIGGNKARKQLEKLQTPTYQPNKAIGDYYSMALSKAMANPYQSQFYTQAQNQANRNQGTAIGALQDRRLALGGIGAIQDQSNQAMQRAGVTAEGLQRQAFGQLGQATNMKAGDDRMAFQYNQVAPYEKQMAILQGKAAGASQMENAGIQNVFGGLSSAAQYSMMKDMYGGGGGATPSAGRGSYSSPGVVLADTGGPGILNPFPKSIAGSYNSFDPNSYRTF